jgi:hypothetical protein
MIAKPFMVMTGDRLCKAYTGTLVLAMQHYEADASVTVVRSPDRARAGNPAWPRPHQTGRSWLLFVPRAHAICRRQSRKCDFENGNALTHQYRSLPTTPCQGARPMQSCISLQRSHFFFLWLCNSASSGVISGALQSCLVLPLLTPNTLPRRLASLADRAPKPAQTSTETT